MEFSVKRFSAALPLLTILLFFILFTSIPLWDPDFFWHLKTGEWIAQHTEIPQEDFFSYTTPAGETLRKKFILGQYWLSQLIFYFVWMKTGTGGIIMLRALLLSSTLFIIYSLMKKKVEPLLLSLFIFISGNVLMYFTGERPQLFSFIGTAMLVFVIERYRETRSRIIYVLPAVTLTWANLHGSVILGDILLLIYILSEGVKLLFGLNQLEKKEYLRFLFFCAIAIIVSAANPNTYNLFTASYQFSKSISQQMSIEFFSPITIAFRYKVIFWADWVILFLTPLLLAARGKKADISHLAIIIFLYVISLLSARYMVFLAAVFPLLAADVIHLVQDKFYRIRVLLGIGILIFMFYSLWGKSLFSSQTYAYYPDKAVEFIKKTMPQGNLFNYFDWGGYLIATLPEYKVFIDGRGIDEGVQVKYNLILNGSTMKYNKKYEWESMLDNYGVNIVLLPLYDSNTGERFRLIDILMNDTEWRLSYSDEKSVVFLRVNPVAFHNISKISFGLT